MPNLSYLAIPSFSIQNNYHFKVIKHTKSTRIIMVCLDHLDTRSLPFTYNLLKKKLPSILSSECFNDSELPFSVEVKKTQLGHLFEHIMLEYICDLKIKGGARKITVSGRTVWNWKETDVGTYNITIDVGRKDYDVFMRAFEQSLSLFKLIINQSQRRNGQINSVRFSKTLS